ncbi:MAG: alpha/beta hydrolase [Ruminococcaceae bacterium]|nr:alpha/beta hydrolase [Oscillospiraceae bacterium]
MKKGAKLVLIGSGITAAVVALAETARYGMAQYLSGVAMNRKMPPHSLQAERKVVASCVNDVQMAQVNQAGKELAVVPHETVTIRGRDGISLTGHWMPVDHPKRIILAMHGWRSAWSHDFGIVAPFFRDNQCSVLYCEQRAHGNSGGKYLGFGLVERYDCLDWVNWLNTKTGGDIPIYLCGLSMGASTVLMAAGLDLPKNVRGIMADCGYTSPVEIWKYVAEHHLHFSYQVCGGPLGRVARGKLRMAMDAESCPQALARSRVPVLFVHGTDDRLVPIEMTFENYKACSAPKQLFIVPGAGHGMSYVVDRKGYQAALTDFWTAFDKNPA